MHQCCAAALCAVMCSSIVRQHYAAALCGCIMQQQCATALSGSIVGRHCSAAFSDNIVMAAFWWQTCDDSIMMAALWWKHCDVGVVKSRCDRGTLMEALYSGIATTELWGSFIWKHHAARLYEKLYSKLCLSIVQQLFVACYKNNTIMKQSEVAFWGSIVIAALWQEHCNCSTWPKPKK